MHALSAGSESAVSVHLLGALVVVWVHTLVLRSDCFALEQLLVGFDEQQCTSVSFCATPSNP